MKKLGSQPIGGSRTSLKPARPGPLEPVLYVEDDDDNWHVAEVRLASSYDLSRARNAEQACRTLITRGTQLAAILMDVGLSGSHLNGVELTELIRGKLARHALPEYAQRVPVLPSIPIIFVTAHGAKYSEAMLLRAGGDRMISKPVDFGALSLALTQLHLERMRKRHT